MPKLLNRAKMSTSTTGTGTITLGSASTGYLSFAGAGVADGDLVRYVIEDGNDWEFGVGTYTASGTTLSRDTILRSSNSDAAISLSGSAVVYSGPVAEDLLGAGHKAVSGTTPDLDLSQSQSFSLTTSGNTTFTFSNPPASGLGFVFFLEVTAGGSHTLTLPASVESPGGSGLAAPPSGTTNLYAFVTRDGGTTWRGVLWAENVS